MLRKFIGIALAVLCLSSCRDSQSLFYVISYDPIQLHQEPSDASPVTQLLSLTGGRPLGCFDAFPEGPKRIEVDLHSRPVPIGVKQLDETGRWAYVEEGFPNGIKGWLRMDQVLWCGTGSNNEVWPAYTVKSKNIPMRYHPRKADSENIIFCTAYQGDTLRVLDKKSGWAHVCRYTHGQNSFRDYNYFGWVPMTDLKWADTLSVASLSAEKRAEAQVRQEASAKAKAPAKSATPKSKYRKGGVVTNTENASDKMQGILKWMYGIGALLALLLAGALYKPAKDKMFEESHLISLIICAVALGVGYFLCGTNNWYVGVYLFLTMFAFTYVVAYPILYLGALGIMVWHWVFLGGGILLALRAFVSTIMFTCVDMGLPYVIITFVIGCAYLGVLWKFPKWFVEDILT